MKQKHYPVMNREITAAMSNPALPVVVDCTCGMGGHTAEILRAVPEVRVIALDVDNESLAIAGKNLEEFGNRVELINLNFTKAFESDEINWDSVGGVVVDPGISMFQMWGEDRGFSHNIDAPLDMRKDRSSGITAGDVINTFREAELTEIFQKYGDVKRAAVVAKRIIEARLKGPIESTFQLKGIVERVFGSNVPRGVVHPAAMVFQALRIFVNRELEGVENFIKDGVERLTSGARIAFLTFHSTEDRMIKRLFRDLDRSGKAKIIKPFPAKPSEEEVGENSASKPAKLRILEVT